MSLLGGLLTLSKYGYGSKKVLRHPKIFSKFGNMSQTTVVRLVFFLTHGYDGMVVFSLEELGPTGHGYGVTLPYQAGGV